VKVGGIGGNQIGASFPEDRGDHLYGTEHRGTGIRGKPGKCLEGDIYAYPEAVPGKQITKDSSCAGAQVDADAERDPGSRPGK